MVDIDALQLEVTLDGQPQVATRLSDQWVVRFTLTDDNSHTLVATWSETVNNQTLPIAVSAPVPVSRVQETRTVSISEYQHRQFDADGDSISNLDERRLGRDPFVVDLVTLGEGQTDCRDLTGSLQFPNFYVPISNPNFNLPVSVPSTLTLSNIEPLPTEGMLAAFDSFWILTPGSFTVTHQSGGPTSTGAALYDTDANGALRLLDQDIAIDNNGQSVNRRAAVSATLNPGVYCYRLESTRVNDQVIDPSLQYSFVSNP